MSNIREYATRFQQAVSDRYDVCIDRPAKSPSLSPIVYAHRLSAGMQAKKYKGGMANKAKFGSLRAFNKFFKPLPTP